MPFDLNRLAIDGVLLAIPKGFADNRGYFVEPQNRRLFEEIGIPTEFVQDNEARSDKVGTRRGSHFQLTQDPQAKVVPVISGSVFSAVVNLRAGSATFGQSIGTTLAARKGGVLFVSVDFAHAYVTLEPKTHVSYKIDGDHTKAAQGVIRWNDPDIGIVWPIARYLQTPFRFHA